MLVSELAAWIRRNKPGLNYPRVHPCADEGVVVQYTRHEMRGDVHITDEHIFFSNAVGRQVALKNTLSTNREDRH